MRTCSHCGTSYPDDILRCSSDGQILVESGLTSSSASSNSSTQTAAVGSELSERQIRIVELLLVCVIAVGGSVLTSLYVLFGKSLGDSHGSLGTSYSILTEAAALVLVWYVLSRRSKSLADIGFSFKWTDIGWAAVLASGGYLIYSFVFDFMYGSGLPAVEAQASGARVSRYLFGGGIFTLTLAFQFINPFFEELIVRAYLMTEVRQLTNSATAAIVCSTVLQTSYHLYQGVPRALATGCMFLIWSIYFAKTRRIMPIILAHLFFDVSAVVRYSLYQ